MEIPNVDNEFINLFIPENSEFLKDEILEEFNYYIFKMMNLSFDALSQELVTITQLKI